VLGEQGEQLRERARAVAAHVVRVSAAGLESICLAAWAMR
jgi:hypothetical protein